MACDNPNAGSVNLSPISKATLETTDEEEEETHKQGTGKQHRTTAPLVDVDDSGDG